MTCLWATRKIPPRSGGVTSLIGKKISHYSVTAKLGEGGMGEVYRATDSRLGREVALKVLPEVFATDSERMARFQREAQVLASLNHTNIASIYGLEEADSICCLVLELVEGETLAERIAKGPIPLEEALPIARQVAEALEAAHERGVIHRDLKPGNIKITPEGKVKVLDFGLAKALEGEHLEADISKSPTLTMAATQAGVILGTAAYMSPEQARGKPVDRRADIWAFGCVLYEMLTGKPAFGGDTISDTLASILKTDLDWNALPADMPPTVRLLLRRCLDKDPKKRLQAIGEARIALEDYRTDATEVAVAAPGEAAWRRPRVWLAGAVLVTAVVTALASWRLQAPVSEQRLRKFDLRLEGLESGTMKYPVISPDGRSVAYLHKGRLWIRELNQMEPRELVGTEGALNPFWSPDSASVAYMAGQKLWRVPASGGQSVLVTELGGEPVGGSGGTWAPDGRIIYSRGSTGILEVSALGGESRTLVEVDLESEADLHDPVLLPDGRSLLLVVHRTQHGPDTLAVFSEGKRKVLQQHDSQAIWYPAYSPSGHILYWRGAPSPGVWAVPFSLSRLEVTGEPFLVAAGANYPSISRDGTLVFVQGAASGRQQLVWVNRSGKVEAAIGQPRVEIFDPAISPDSRRVVAMANEGDAWDLWLFDSERGTATRLTFGSPREWNPAWTPDGKQIGYWETQSLKILLQPADGTGEKKVLAEGIHEGGEPHFSADGHYMVYSVREEKTLTDLWYRRLDGKGEAAIVLQTSAREEQPRISPDGGYVAYVSDESGRLEVYLKLFPGGEGKWQVSVNGGTWPRWSRSGKKLFYREGDSLMEVAINIQPALALGTPQKLLSVEARGIEMTEPFRYDVAGEGERFVFVQNVEQEGNRGGLVVVENWFAEFKDRN